MRMLIGTIFLSIIIFGCVQPEEPICEDMCGDGICQEIVCLATGCPCAETPGNCPQDCQETNQTDGQFCDAVTPCQEGYECYKFEDEDTPICWPVDTDPCSRCSSGECNILESYPMQIRCIEEPVCEDRCGDGVCQEVVCEAIGCPCAETSFTCPEDCPPEQECAVCG